MKRLIPLVVIAALCLTGLGGATPTAAQSGNVWRLDYYNNLDWAGSPVTTAYNSFVAFDWGYGSPSPAVRPDNFTGRFTTDAYFYAGNYTFTLTADDEVALIVDGVTLLDTRNAGASGKTFTVNFGMWEGMHRVEALYREYTQLAYVYINWAYTKPGTTPPPPPTRPRRFRRQRTIASRNRRRASRRSSATTRRASSRARTSRHASSRTAPGMHRIWDPLRRNHKS